MARKPRIEFVGFHHVVNRGVARGEVYLCRKDRETFLEILCKACEDYRVNLHDYALMDNHYHLLIETTQENLSLFMRQLNSNYAIYFNKKYQRTGHLWQGRYKSWYVYDEEYLYKLFRYIEHNPIKANISSSVGEFEFTLMGPLLNRYLKLPKCAEHSMLNKMIYEDGMQALLEIALDDDELHILEEMQKRKVVMVEHEYQAEELEPIACFFSADSSKLLRNEGIYKAFSAGHKQATIARALGVSESMVSKVIKKWKDSSPDPKNKE